MIRLDISQIESAGDTFFSPTDTAYLIFLCIGIVGYFSVPSVANYVIHAHGGSGLLNRVTQVSTSVVSSAASASVSGGAYLGERSEQARGNILGARADFMEGWTSAGDGGTGRAQQDKIAGK